MFFASNKRIKSSIYKANTVAQLLKGLSVSNAVMQLQFLNKSVARVMLSILNSAIANSNNSSVDSLYVSEIKVSKDFVLKRSRPRSKGSSCRIVKPYIRVAIFLKSLALQYGSKS